MEKFRDRVAVVTGAASGIGRSLAYRLANANAKLAISDINEEGLAETREECERRGAQVHVQTLDVSNRNAFFTYADMVTDHYGEVHLLINNAGVAMGGTIEELSIEDFEWLMGINYWGVVYGTKAFLPHLKRADWGHIVNVSSIFGIIAVPGQGAYNSAKFAVRGFTECLRLELESAHSHVSASSVHPGGIKTNIARHARVAVAAAGALGDKEKLASRFEKSARTTPDEAARVILQGVANNNARILVGTDAKVVDVVQRLFPVRYQSAVKRLAKHFGQ